MAKLLLLFTIVPLVELWLLLEIGGEVGALPTLAGVIVVGVVGSWLGKREGMKVLHAVREALAAGRMPDLELVEGAVILVGAVLLVTPGVLTDVAGVACLVPPSRRLVARALRAHFARRLGAVTHRPASEQTVETEARPTHPDELH